MKDKQLTFLITLVSALGLILASLSLMQKNINLSALSVSFRKTDPITIEQTDKLPRQLTISSKAFVNEGAIPELYTCKGKDINPPLTIGNLPAGTKSLVLIVDDPDAPYKTWTHWLVFNIDPRQKEIAQGTMPWNANLGESDFGTSEYRGPCPPLGKHRYFFRLFALNSRLDIDNGATRAQLEETMDKHILDTAELFGVFER